MKNTALAAKFNDTETEQASLLFHFSRGCNNFPRVVTTEQKNKRLLSYSVPETVQHKTEYRRPITESTGYLIKSSNG